MKASTLALIANLAPDGGKELQAQQEAQEAQEKAEQEAQEAAEELATTAALASVDWDRVHGPNLRKHDITLADYCAAWQTAKIKGDTRHSMCQRPIRPDWYATPDLPVNEHYAPMASAPRACHWQAPEPKRWIIGEGTQWEGKDGATRTRSVVIEAKGARDDRTSESPCLVAYAPRAYEGAEGPHRAPTLEQQQAAQLADWQAELDRVNEGRSKP